MMHNQRRGGPSSPPPSVASSASTTTDLHVCETAATSSQPIYTTAGTIYNPSNNHPLQPPLRRGRSFRQHREPIFFTPGFETPPVAEPDHPPTSTVMSLQEQYSPLRQNYDKAIRPAPGMKALQNRRSVPSLGIAQSSHLSPLNAPEASSGMDSQDVKYTETNGNDLTVDKRDINPLLSLTTHSLKNLASYENPNQEHARRLLRSNAATRSIANPSRHFSVCKGDSWEQLASASLNYPPGLEDRILDRKRRLQSWTESNLAYTATTAQPPMPVQDATSRRLNTILASGPGAPRPLTAGPPGQRKFRPAVVETSWNNLNTTPALTIPTTAVGQVLTASNGTNGIKTNHFVSSAACNLETPRPIRPLNRFLAARQASGSRVSMDDFEDTGKDGVSETRYAFLVRDSDSLGLTQPEPIADAGGSPMLKSEPAGDEYGTARSSATRFAARQARINDCWYECPQPDANMWAGVQSEKLFPEKGEAKALRRQQSIEMKQPISVETANRIPVSEDAKVLLAMAFPALKRFVEEQSYGNTSKDHQVAPAMKETNGFTATIGQYDGKGKCPRMSAMPSWQAPNSYESYARLID